MTIIDLKSHPFLSKMFGKTLWGGTDVYRTIDFQAGYGLHPFTNLSPLRSKVPRRLQSKNLLMPRPVPMHGICSTHAPGESPRYRNLLALSKQKTLSHGRSWKSFQVNSCRSQRKTRLANICRIRSEPNRYSQRVIQGRFLSRRTERNSICSGCNHHRSLPVCVPVGIISQEKSCRQTPYTIGPEGQHSNVHSHFRRQVERCQRSRSSTIRRRCLLHYGSRLSGLQKTLLFQPDSSIFCYPSQEEPSIQKTLFTSRRQDNWASVRSNDHANRVLSEQTLSRHPASSEVPGSKFQKDTCVSHQQFYFATANDCSTVPQPLASGAFFQMDQAAPENKEILWYFGECSQDTGLDSSLCLCPRCDTEKTSQTTGESLHNFTNFKRISFRKDRTLSAGYRKRL